MLAYCIRKKRTGKDNSELEIHNMWDRNPTLNEVTFLPKILRIFNVFDKSNTNFFIEHLHRPNRHIWAESRQLDFRSFANGKKNVVFVCLNSSLQFYQPNHNRAQYPIRGGNVSPYSQQNVGNGNSENDHLLTVDEGGPSIYDPSNADQARK